MKKINSETLYELINDGTIKANTKMRVYKDDVYITTITFDGYDFIWETGTFSSGMLFNPLCDFEIIEEDKKIERFEMCTGGIMGFDGVENITSGLKDKINEIIDELNKLKVSK